MTRRDPFDDLETYDRIRYGHDIENEFQSGTDFDEMLADRERAFQAPGGGINSEIQAFVNLKRIQDARLNREAPRVRINPKGTGTLGNTVNVTSNLPPLSLVNWINDDDEGATTYTVGIWPTMDQGGNLPLMVDDAGTVTNAKNRPYAYVKWGNRAAPCLAEVDICKGLQFSVSGAMVAVSVGLDQFSTATAGTMQLSGSVGFYGAPRTSPVTRTRYISALAASQSTNVVIPAFARQLLPPQRTPLSVAFTLRIRDVNQTTIYLITGGGGATSFAVNPIPLSDDAYDVRVTNDDGASTLDNIRLIFELGL